MPVHFRSDSLFEMVAHKVGSDPDISRHFRQSGIESSPTKAHCNVSIHTEAGDLDGEPLAE